MLALSGSGSVAAGTEPLLAGDPSWSPDGESIAFDGRVAGGAPDIYTIAVDGTGLRNLTPDDPGWNILPSWGRRIGDIAYETDFSNPLVVMVRYSLVAPDGTGGRVLAPNESAIGPIYWSPGDRYIAYDRRFDAVALALSASETTTGRFLALGASGPWAPRMQRVAIAVEKVKVNDSHLVTMSPTGTARRPLTHGRESVRALAWSRDGRWILFEGERSRVSGFNLYVVNLPTGRIVRLATGARAGDFSPDGKRVVYSTEQGGVYLVSRNLQVRRRLSADGNNPRWSPDGRWIAFGVNTRIDVIRPDGMGRHPLVGS